MPAEVGRYVSDPKPPIGIAGVRVRLDRRRQRRFVPLRPLQMLREQIGGIGVWMMMLKMQQHVAGHAELRLESSRLAKVSERFVQMRADQQTCGEVVMRHGKRRIK